MHNRFEAHDISLKKYHKKVRIAYSELSTNKVDYSESFDTIVEDLKNNGKKCKWYKDFE